MHPLAEIPYPRIDPVAFTFFGHPVRWYGISYILAFLLAFLVLRMLARRGRWPVPADRVADVLFWGILGVFFGGRLGYIFFYMIPEGDFAWSKVYRVNDGGMSFHGGLLGVIIAYVIYTWRTKTKLGDLFDGLTLATPLGIASVRLANFINAELWGRVTDSWVGMRFPNYGTNPDNWEKIGKPMLADLRHPSQLYEMFFEGILMFFVLRFLMLRVGIGAGRIAALFLMLYGAFRFFIEYAREPDAKLGPHYFLGFCTQGQGLCLGMILAGIVVWFMCRRPNPGPGSHEPLPLASAAEVSA